MRTDTAEIKKFGISLGVILVWFGLVQLLRGKTAIYLWFFGVSLAVFLLVLVSPLALKPLFIIFTKVGRFIGWINTRILLAFIFYGLFTPISLILKLLRIDFLDRNIKKSSKTYWLNREKIDFSRSDFEKQF